MRPQRRRRITALAVLLVLCLALNVLPAVKHAVTSTVARALATVLNLDDSSQQHQASAIANGLIADQRDDAKAAASGAEQLRNRQDALAGRLVMGRAISLSAIGQTTARVQLNVGSADGVQRDRAVVTDAGLLGRITQVSAHTSTATLITDDSSVVAARVKGKPTLGALAGRRTGVTATDSRPALSFTVPSGAKVAAGDVLVTAGSADSVPYPAGIKIGRVVSVDADQGQPERTALVRPYSSTTGIDVVGVVTTPSAKKAS